MPNSAAAKIGFNLLADLFGASNINHPARVCRPLKCHAIALTPHILSFIPDTSEILDPLQFFLQLLDILYLI